MHLSGSTVVYDSVSPILYNPTFLFRLNFVISCHAQLETLACAKMRACGGVKPLRSPGKKKIDRYYDIIIIVIIIIILVYIFIIVINYYS